MKSMQDDLDKLNDWSATWQLKFNADKCKVMHLGHKNIKHQYTMKSKPQGSQQQCDRTILKRTEVEKDLGVYVDDQLKFNKHASTAASKANRILGVIKRSFTCLDADSLSRLYKTMVRPHLEYANVIWGPTRIGDSKRIESVQRRATRFIPELKHLPYEDRLRALKMPSMKHRRLRGDMIQTFKIIKGIDRLDPEELFSKPPCSTTRGHSEKLHVVYSRTQIRQHYFCNRIVAAWNSLPQEAINSKNTLQFKIALDKLWSNNMYDSDLSVASRLAHTRKVTKIDQGPTGNA